MGSNFKKSFNDDCFKDLKNDFNRLIRNFKKNYCKSRRIQSKKGINNNLKWYAIGGVLTLLIISQIGIPIAFLCTLVILIIVLCGRW